MSPGEARPLSPTDISAHLACNHLTHLEHLRRNHQLQVALHSDPRLEAMIQRGIEHEEQYVQELEREGLRVVRLPSSRDPAITLAAMQDGVDVIVQAPLGNGAMAGIAVGPCTELWRGRGVRVCDWRWASGAGECVLA